jgi:hypothetical protein
MFGGFFGMTHSDLIAYLHSRVHGKKLVSKGVAAKGALHSCKLCWEELPFEKRDSESHEKRDTDAMAIVLECKHGFHNACLRGWALLGKKASCPACGERSYALEQLHCSNPWEKTDEAWIGFLQAARFVFTFLPLGMLVIWVLKGVWKGEWMCSPLYLYHSLFLLM